MKTEISRNSHNPEKKYSGVYQQQGRMITDADWNELVDILKGQLNEALKDVVGSGTPRVGGLVITADAKIETGQIYVDGVPAEVRGKKSVVSYNEQTDFPAAPEITAPDYLLYADVWERAATSLEDDGLIDAALHGADTCTRTQTMAQIKSCPLDSDPEDSKQNPAIGNAELSLKLRSGTTTSDGCDPCADVVVIDEFIGNYLFRVEVHDVKGDASDPDEITLKWSSENGAEQYEVDSVPSTFKDDKWVYEFFDENSEKHLGVHLIETSASGFRGQLEEGYPASSPGDFTHVRRWDGYCTLNMKSGKLTAGRDRAVFLSSSADAAKAGYVNFSTNLLKINLSAMELLLKVSNKDFVAGDYWLGSVRDNATDPNQLLPVNAQPNGIRHHYLTLAKIEAGTVKAVSGEYCRRHGFPPLTDIQAADICIENNCNKLYDNAETVQQALDNLCSIKAADITYTDGCPKLYDGATTVKEALDNLCSIEAADIGFTPDCATLSNTTNVQEALNVLCARDMGNGCARTVGEGGYYPDLETAFEDIKEERAIALCLLPGDHEIVSEPDLPMMEVLKMTGVGTDASKVLITPQKLDLLSDVLILRDISFLINSRNGVMTLTASQLDVQSCSFERKSASKNAMSVVKVVAKDDKATIHWENNYVVSIWKESIFKANDVLIGDAVLAPGLIKKLKHLAASDPHADAGKYKENLLAAADGLAAMNYADRKELAASMEAEIAKLPEKESSFIGMAGAVSLSAAATNMMLSGARARVIKPYIAGTPANAAGAVATAVSVRNPDKGSILKDLDTLIKVATNMGYGDCLGLSNHHISGVIQSNQFDGNIVLNANLTNAVDLGAKNPIKKAHPELEMPLFPDQLDGTLRIAGNQCQRIITLFPLSSVGSSNGMLGPHGDEYQTLFVSENTFSGIQNSLVAGTLHFQSNQFSDTGEGELLFVLSNSAMYTGNGASEESRVINTMLSRNKKAANWLTVS